MARIRLTDGSGKWFDSDQAESWDEKRDEHGASPYTGSLYAGERLWRTRNGTWVLEEWDNNGVPERNFSEADAHTAHEWLETSGYLDDVPADYLAEFEI